MCKYLITLKLYDPDRYVTYVQINDSLETAVIDIDNHPEQWGNCHIWEVISIVKLEN